MLVRVNGGSSGICAYLAEGMKSGREHSRDELDEHVILSGDLQVLDKTLALFDVDAENEKYLHITLSFKEENIPTDQLRAIDTEFKKFLFTACREDEFYYYSEAHLPKIKSLPDKDGNEYERFPHIHAVIPKYNLITGEKDYVVDMIPKIERYLDAFQETVNYRYNLESPKDNIREISGGREAILNRHKLTAEMSRQQVKEEIATIIKSDKSIQSIDELAVVLGAFGQTTVRDSKKFGGKYINLNFADNRKAINLKDPIFLDEYLATRNPQLIGKEEQIERDKLLETWEKTAQKIRFIDRKSPNIRADYHNMNEVQQREYLQQKMSEHLALLDSILPPLSDNIQSQPLRTPELSRHIEAGIHFDEYPHIDDIPHIDDLPHIDEIKHFEEQDYDPTEKNQSPENQQGTTRHDMHGLRVRGGDGNSGKGSNLPEQNPLPTTQRNDVERDQKIQFTNVYALRGAGNVSRERQFGRVNTAIHNTTKATWTEKINSVDLRGLLNHLSYQYGLNTDNIQIVRSKKGYERIQVENRRYSASDFMAKHLHLNWNEIRKNLDTVLDSQSRETHQAAAITSNLMWNRFQRHEATLDGLSGVNALFREQRADILERTKFTTDDKQSKAKQSSKFCEKTPIVATTPSRYARRTR